MASPPACRNRSCASRASDASKRFDWCSSLKFGEKQLASCWFIFWEQRSFHRLGLVPVFLKAFEDRFGPVWDVCLGDFTWASFWWFKKIGFHGFLYLLGMNLVPHALNWIWLTLCFAMIMCRGACLTLWFPQGFWRFLPLYFSNKGTTET